MLRFLLPLMLLCSASIVRADDVADKAATVKFILSLQDAETGAFKVTADGKPSLRACNGGVKALRALEADVPMLEKIKTFAASCYDAKTGVFAEPGGKPDVAINAVGILVVMELGLDKTKYAGAMTYLKENAKTWEDVRIAAAAVEAWGVKECPFALEPWVKIAVDEALNAHFEDARFVGGLLAFDLRLKLQTSAKPLVVTTMLGARKADGGWGFADKTTSDLETCYRVMRALHMTKADGATTKAAYADVAKFVKSCRKADGGYGVAPNAPSTLSGVYYAVMIEKWLK